MKQIFDWLREQIDKYSYDTETCSGRYIDIIEEKHIIKLLDEAEAKWKADCSKSARLIDANAFKERIGTETKMRRMMCMAIDEQPTAYDVEKVVEQLEQEQEKLDTDIWARECDNWYGQHCNGMSDGIDKAIEIVQEVAKNGGWIPCSERLPEKDQRCLVQYNGAMSGFEDYMDVDTYNGEMFEFFGSKYVVAWQPLPEKYQKGEHT